MATPAAQGSVTGALLMALGTCLASAPSVTAQAPLDMFGTHFGAARMPVIAPQWWASASFMLITELDGRWADPETPVNYPDLPDLQRYDGLTTTAAYNYLTVGGQRVLNNAHRFWSLLPRHTAVTYAGSAHLGVTHDALIEAGQRAFHDFRRVTHIKRLHVSNGDFLGGVDGQVLVWPGRRSYAFGVQGSLTTFHREIGVTAVGRIVRRKLHHWRASVVATGALVGSRVKPDRIADRLDSGYWSVRVLWEHRDELGVGYTFSEGIFEGESEHLISIYFAAQLGSTTLLRFEFVNDLLGGKDRGPTGGIRVAYAKTF